jgi:hypothetical protein
MKLPDIPIVGTNWTPVRTFLVGVKSALEDYFNTSAEVVEKPEIVEGLTLSVKPGGALLTWRTVTGASSYTVYRADNSTLFSSAVAIANLPRADNISFFDPFGQTSPNMVRTYWVKAVNSVDEESDLSSPVATVELGSPLPGPNEITTTMIDDEAITTPKLVANCVTTDKIAARAITSTSIATGAITADLIGANAIASPNIQAGAITADKLAVAQLDAISANLGSVTAGTITGVTIRTNTTGPRINLDNLTGLEAFDGGGNLRAAIPTTGQWAGYFLTQRNFVCLPGYGVQNSSSNSSIAFLDNSVELWAGSPIARRNVFDAAFTRLTIDGAMYTLHVSGGNVTVTPYP